MYLSMVDFVCKDLHSKQSSNPMGAHCQTGPSSASELAFSILVTYMWQPICRESWCPKRTQLRSAWEPRKTSAETSASEIYAAETNHLWHSEEALRGRLGWTGDLQLLGV